MGEVKVQFKGIEGEFLAPEGGRLYDVIVENGLSLESFCGGRGTCGKCRVLILENPPEPDRVEEKFISPDDLKSGWRLACRTEVKGGMVLQIPQVSQIEKRKTSTDNLDRPVLLDTNVQKYYIEFSPQSLENQVSDIDLIREVIDKNGKVLGSVNFKVLKDIPSKLREDGYKATLTFCGEELIGIDSGDTTKSAFGIAFDIGTTTVVGILHDLNTGEELAADSILNPQTAFGADVVSRINYSAEDERGLSRLHEEIIGGVNSMIEGLSGRAKISKDDIYELTVVGNTTMQHLFLGVSPLPLAHSPYVPVFGDSINIDAKDIGLDLKRAKVHINPCIASYVGGDTVGVALSTRIHQSDEIQLAIDIGTNGETLLGSKELLLACSNAAGPAFEGAKIKYGMRAAPGAIERVSIKNGDLSIKVIGRVEPKGICGSGLIDAVAELIKSGIVDQMGRILEREELEGKVDERLLSRVQKDDGENKFLLSENPEVAITQRDVRELQLAKGAIQAGIEILRRELKIEVGEIARVFLAGAFGNYIDKNSARTIRLVPDFPSDRIVFVGNAAGTGSKMTLLSRKYREEADTIAKRVRYIELAGRSDFQEEFMNSMLF